MPNFSLIVVVLALCFCAHSTFAVGKKKSKFLIIHRAHEGFSEWRLTLHRVFLLAIRYDYVLVEPCIVAGALTSCFEHNSEATVHLSQAFDMDVAYRHYPGLKMSTIL